MMMLAPKLRAAVSMSRMIESSYVFGSIASGRISARRRLSGKMCLAPVVLSQ